MAIAKEGEITCDLLVTALTAISPASRPNHERDGRISIGIRENRMVFLLSAYGLYICDRRHPDPASRLMLGLYLACTYICSILFQTDRIKTPPQTKLSKLSLTNRSTRGNLLELRGNVAIAKEGETDYNVADATPYRTVAAPHLPHLRDTLLVLSYP